MDGIGITVRYQLVYVILGFDPDFEVNMDWRKNG